MVRPFPFPVQFWSIFDHKPRSRFSLFRFLYANFDSYFKPIHTLLRHLLQAYSCPHRSRSTGCASAAAGIHASCCVVQNELANDIQLLSCQWRHNQHPVSAYSVYVHPGVSASNTLHSVLCTHHYLVANYYSTLIDEQASMLIVLGVDHIGHQPYRSQKYRPQTVSATGNDHVSATCLTIGASCFDNDANLGLRI